MSQAIAFRRSLPWRLIVSLVLLETAVTAMTLFERQLGLAQFPVLLVVAAAGFYFLKLLLGTAWYDTTALPLERSICRSLVYIQVLGFIVFLAGKLPGAGR